MRHRGPDHQTRRRSCDTPDGRHVDAAARPADHHRSRPARQPAVRRRLAVDGLQRRALQLPRAARALERGGRTVHTTLRHRGAAAARSTRTGWAALDALRGHVGVRGLRRGGRDAAACAAIASARSRSIVHRDGDGGLYFGSEIKFFARCSGRTLAARTSRSSPLPRQRLQGALQAAARRSSTGSTSCPRAPSLRSSAAGGEHARRVLGRPAPAAEPR